MIGCLMYLTTTRPDILNYVSILSQFMHYASEMHLKATKKKVLSSKTLAILAFSTRELKNSS